MKAIQLMAAPDTDCIVTVWRNGFASASITIRSRPADFASYKSVSACFSKLSAFVRFDTDAVKPMLMVT